MKQAATIDDVDDQTDLTDHEGDGAMQERWVRGLAAPLASPTPPAPLAPLAPPRDAATPTSLIVLVAATVEDRARLLAQLDPGAPVLVVPSVAAAQQLLARDGTARMVRAEPSPGAAASSPGLQIHEDRQSVGFGTVEVSLTPLEVALLRRLIREPGRVWRFDELVRHVWGTDHLGDASQVHAVVKPLRAKLAREHAPVAIEAVRGVGFRAVRPEVTPAS